MKSMGLASVLTMVFGVSLGEITYAGDCGCTTSAPAVVRLRPPVRDEDGLRAGTGYGRANVHGDGVRSGNADPQGRLLRDVSRDENRALHVYGHGSSPGKATADVLRDGARNEASDRELPGTGADFPHGGKLVYGLPSGLERSGGAVYGDGACVRNPQGMRCETHCVPVKETCNWRCVDRGHWEDRPFRPAVPAKR